MTSTPTLDAELAAEMKADLERFGPRDKLARDNLEAMRADYLRRRLPRAMGGPTMRESRTDTFAGPGGELRLRLHVPSSAAATGPALVYFNGGGFVWGSIDSHDRIMREIAAASGVRVVGIDYRKAPEHPFPAAYEDCLAGIDAVAARAGALGIDAARLAFGGDSAGANLALACALHGTRVPATVLLIYGALSLDGDMASCRGELGDGRFGLSRSDMQLFNGWYVGSTAAPADPRAAPLAGDLARLRRAFVLGAGLDPLRDDSRELAVRLARLGIDHEFVEYPAANHGFLHFVGDVVLATRAVARTAEHLRLAVAD